MWLALQSDGSIGEDHGPETHLIPNILKSAISGDGNFTIFGDDYDTKDGTNVPATMFKLKT